MFSRFSEVSRGRSGQPNTDGELLDEFTFSFTDRNLTELCLSAEDLPNPRNAEPAPGSLFLTNRKIAGDLCQA